MVVGCGALGNEVMKNLVLMGATGPRIEKAVREDPNFNEAELPIQHADNIIVLSHGKILEQGTHQQLLANHGRYYQLYMLQYHKEQLSQ